MRKVFFPFQWGVIFTDCVSSDYLALFFSILFFFLVFIGLDLCATLLSVWYLLYVSVVNGKLIHIHRRAHAIWLLQYILLQNKYTLETTLRRENAVDICTQCVCVCICNCQLYIIVDIFFMFHLAKIDLE